MLLIALCWAAPAAAQLRSVPPADPLHAGERVNAFAEWPGPEPLAGVLVELPDGWALEEAVAVSARWQQPVPLAVTRRSDGAAVAQLPRPLRETTRLVLGLRVGEELGYREATFVPLAGRDLEPARAWSARWGSYVQEPPPRQNHAFRLGGPEPVVLRRHALPSLDPRDPLTVEFWIRTVALDEVVLSTWDGDENRPYPLEFGVDALGRLVAYRGRGGAHDRLATRRPVADGLWHHAALTHDPEAGWTRLYLDGALADSLRTLDAVEGHNTMSLALGGRPLRPGQPQRRPFTGTLDELRLWPTARAAAALYRTYRLPLEEPPADVLRLGFEEPIPEGLLLRPPAAPARVLADLSFAHPVEGLEANVEEGVVVLTWQTRDRRVEAFEIERSADGEAFEPVGTVRADEGAGAAGPFRFTYTDLPPEGHVVYYRVRQRSDSGAEHLSGILKLGLGAEADAVAIVGNSPNPFRSHTLVTIELARPQPVQLTVWDLAGTRVATLLDGPLPAGRHTLRFEADGLPSGVYFVRLQTPAGGAAHKVTLAK